MYLRLKLMRKFKIQVRFRRLWLRKVLSVDIRMVLVYAVANGILNIILDPVFIFPLGFEIVGAAIATMLFNVVATLYFNLYNRRPL